MNRQFPRVLIVEDEETICHIFARIFEIWKWDVRKAHTCERALALLATGEVYDLVLLDLMLPDRDGIGVLGWLREQGSPTKVIVFTAKSIDGVDDVAALKPDLLLHKPFVFEPIRAMADDIATHFFLERAGRMAARDVRP